MTELRKIKRKLKQCARKRDIEAMQELGEFYGSIGTKKGFKYYAKAAGLGSVSACREIVLFYYTKGYEMANESLSFNKAVVREILNSFKIVRKWIYMLKDSDGDEVEDMIKSMNETVCRIRKNAI